MSFLALFFAFFLVRTRGFTHCDQMMNPSSRSTSALTCVIYHTHCGSGVWSGEWSGVEWMEWSDRPINWARCGHDDPIDAMISGSGYWRGIFCKFAERFTGEPPPQPSKKLLFHRTTAAPAGREATAVCVAPL